MLIQLQCWNIIIEEELDLLNTLGTKMERNTKFLLLTELKLK